MSWRRKEPGHQLRWYWHCWTGMIRPLYVRVKGRNTTDCRLAITPCYIGYKQILMSYTKAIYPNCRWCHHFRCLSFNPHMTYIDKKINPGVAKPPLNFNGGSPKPRLTSLVFYIFIYSIIYQIAECKIENCQGCNADGTCKGCIEGFFLAEGKKKCKGTCDNKHTYVWQLPR